MILIKSNTVPLHLLYWQDRATRNGAVFLPLSYFPSQISSAMTSIIFSAERSRSQITTESRKILIIYLPKCIIMPMESGRGVLGGNQINNS